MKKRKKWVGFCLMVGMLVLLVACSKTEEESVETIFLSDAIEEYSVWFYAEGESANPTEDSNILQLFVFDRGELTIYELTHMDMNLGELAKFSDEEVVSHVDEQLAKEDGEYVEPEASPFTLDIHQDAETKKTFAITVDVDVEVLLTLLQEPVANHISDTEFAGLTVDYVPDSDVREMFVTRVENSSIVLELDRPDTKKNYVTIDEWKERQKQTDLEGQNLQELDEEEYEEIFNEPGAEIYAITCMACHGENLEGDIGPELSLVGDRFSEDEIKDIALNGKGNMPPSILENEEDAEILAKWLSEHMRK